MNHNDIRHMLSEYIDNAVTFKERAAIEEHLATCEKCSEALRELKQTVAHIKSVEESEPPAWMTHKIMATVRAAAEKKSWAQRFFFPLHSKLPLEAVGVLFLAVTALFIYQTITKQTYEKPAPPMLQDQAAAPAPKAPAGKNQAYPAEGENARTFLKKEEADSERMMDRAMTSPGTARETAGKTESAAAVAPPTGGVAADKAIPAIILQVMDLKATAINVEKAIAQVNGSIIRREAPGPKMIFFITIKARRTSELQNKLDLLGELTKLPDAKALQEDQVELRIELVKKPSPH